MRRLFALLLIATLAVACAAPKTVSKKGIEDFVRVDGADLVTPEGEKLFIRGTNLGNWLNPEGYMFGFQKVNSAHFIDEMLRQGYPIMEAYERTGKVYFLSEERIRKSIAQRRK